MCPKCNDDGMVETYYEYPWGGGDWLTEFCDCSAGLQEEAMQHAFFIGVQVIDGLTGEPTLIEWPELGGPSAAAEANQGDDLVCQ